MKLRDAVLVGFAGLAFMGWTRAAFRASSAEREAAALDVRATEAEDSAETYREQRDDERAVGEAARLAFEDSLIVWAERAALANGRAQAAQQRYQQASAELSATLDSAQTVLLDEIETQHKADVVAARELGRQEGRQQATEALQPRISSLERQVLLADAELEQLHAALDARAQAEDMLKAQLHREKMVGWAVKGVAAAGWLCAALCR